MLELEHGFTLEGFQEYPFYLSRVCPNQYNQTRVKKLADWFAPQFYSILSHLIRPCGRSSNILRDGRPSSLFLLQSSPVTNRRLLDPKSLTYILVEGDFSHHESPPLG